MKYIRTKDTIFEVENPKPFSIFLCKPKHVEMLVCVGEDKYEMRNIIINRSIGRKHWKTEILKQANTIEELCDEFIWENIDTKEIKVMPKNADHKGTVIYFSSINIYGAIWTDKGLIYVAKMNDKGELELL